MWQLRQWMMQKKNAPLLEDALEGKNVENADDLAAAIRHVLRGKIKVRGGRCLADYEKAVSQLSDEELLALCERLAN